MMAAAVAAAAFIGQVALAQPDGIPLAGVLPDTTVFALFAQPGAASPTVFEEVIAELEVEAAMETLRKLGVVLGSAADDAFGLGDVSGADLSGPDGFKGLVEELTADCPELRDALGDLEPERFMSRAAVGFTLSSFTMMPTVVAVVRPDDAELGGRLFEAVTRCYDSGVAMSEGDTPLYVLADGSDFPMVVAQVDDTLLGASNPEVVRAMVRLAAGANEPSMLDTRLGRLAGTMSGRGLAMTLDLAGLADVLGNLVPMLGNDSEQTKLLERVLATMRVVNGVAVSGSFDEAGLVIDSVVSIDRQAGEASGEQALLDLLSCAACEPGEPALIPGGPASLGRTSFSVQATVAWLDSWLADVGPLFGEQLSVAGLVDQYLGVDAGDLALDWLGSTWHTAQLDVYDTDAAAWLQGPGTITTVPVSSEDAARDGLALWGAALENGSSLFAELLDDAAFDEDLDLASTVSVRPVSYRGITYDRVRTPFSGDYGVAVFGGQLVTTRPAATMEAVIDVHLGGVSVVDDPVFGRLIASQPGAPAGYEIVDLPRYLGGLASITDLAAGPIASTMLIAVQAAVMDSREGSAMGDDAGDDDGDASASDDEPDDDQGKAGIDPAAVPTFDELIGLADLVTQALELLAERTGIAILSTETIDGVIWSTLRVPLR